MTNQYRKTLDRYKGFCPEGDWDFSKTAADECFSWESHGTPKEPSKGNGFALGKKFMDVTVAAWREDLEADFPWPLSLRDLREDFDEPFLKKVLGPTYSKALARCPL